MQCKFIKQNGQQCQANALKKSKFCFMHCPKQQQARNMARRNGGLARKNQQKYFNSKFKLKSPEDIQRLIEATLNSLLMGKMPSKNPASQVAYLANVWLTAYEKSELLANQANFKLRPQHYIVLPAKNDPKN